MVRFDAVNIKSVMLTLSDLALLKVSPEHFVQCAQTRPAHICEKQWVVHLGNYGGQWKMPIWFYVLQWGQ